METAETYCLLDGEGSWWVGDDPDDLGYLAATSTFVEAGTVTPLRDNAAGIIRHYGIDARESVLGIPCATADGYTWPSLAQGSTIAHDAHEAVYGRADAYGHPRENLTRTAHLWTALLQPLLADGEYVTPEDVARCMVAVKLSRDVSHPKRDNRVDMAGYAIALDRLATGQ